MTIAISIVLILVALFMIVTVLLQSSNARGLGAIAGEVASKMSKSQAKAADAKLALGTAPHSLSGAAMRSAAGADPARRESQKRCLPAFFAYQMARRDERRLS